MKRAWVLLLSCWGCTDPGIVGYNCLTESCDAGDLEWSCDAAIGCGEVASDADAVCDEAACTFDTGRPAAPVSVVDAGCSGMSCAPALMPVDAGTAVVAVDAGCGDGACEHQCKDHDDDCDAGDCDHLRSCQVQMKCDGECEDR